MARYAVATCNLSASSQPNEPGAGGQYVRVGTGHVLSSAANSKMSCPAACKPFAWTSTIASMPPYAGGGTGSHGGATIATRTRLLSMVGGTVSGCGTGTSA